MTANIVSFANPPVIERVIGVQFESLGLTSGHLGKFWGQLPGEWTEVDDMPRLADEFETFGKRAEATLPGFRFETRPSIPANRLRIHTRRGDRMLQIQDTRFVLNWIKKDGSYPRFREILAEFEGWFAKFRDFAASSNLGEIETNQWQVVYVNHIAAGELWNEPGDWPRVIPGLLLKVDNFGGTRFERMSGEWHSEIPERQGRLHTQVQYRSSEPEKVLRLSLTARGPIREGESLGDRLTVGHDAIVKSFSDITSPEAQRVWGKESNGNGRN